MGQGLSVSDQLFSIIEMVEGGDTTTALASLEALARTAVTPLVCSYLAYCTAVERGEFVNAVSLCRQVLADEPDNPVHYLNLARIYRHFNRRGLAVQTLRNGLRMGPHEGIIRELDRLGIRQRPPIPFLARNHLLNKWLGLVRHRVHLSRPDPLQYSSSPDKV